MKKRGRPKSKKADFKKPFPMRYSDKELKLFKLAAGAKPLREWMRETLIQSIFRDADTPNNPKLLRMVVEFSAAEFPEAYFENKKRPVQLP